MEEHDETTEGEVLLSLEGNQVHIQVTEGLTLEDMLAILATATEAVLQRIEEEQGMALEPAPVLASGYFH